MKNELINCSDDFTLQVYDVASTISDLLCFLTIYDDKFEKFSTTLNINLTDKDANCFNLTLEDCKKLSIENLPNIQEFIKMVINKGGSEKTFKIFTIKNLLRNYTIKEKNTINSISANIILNKSIK